MSSLFPNGLGVSMGPMDPFDTTPSDFVNECKKAGIVIPEPFCGFVPGESLRDHMLRRIAGAVFFLISSSREAITAFVNEVPNMEEVLKKTYQYANTRKIAHFLNVTLRLGLFKELGLSFDDVMLYLVQNGHITQSAYDDYCEKTHSQQLSQIAYLYSKYLTVCSNEGLQFPRMGTTALIEMSMILDKLLDADLQQYSNPDYNEFYHSIEGFGGLIHAFFFEKHTANIRHASKEMQMMGYIVILHKMKAIYEKHISGKEYSINRDIVLSFAQTVARIGDIKEWTEEAYAVFVQRYLHQKCPISVHEYDTLEKVKALSAFFATLVLEKKPTHRRF